MGHAAAAVLLPAAPVGRVSVREEMEASYIDYAMSVIVSRALPDARDGQKPVHRRIIYGAEAGGYRSDKKHVKSAKVVGDVMGSFHPHGDASIYDALVRMAQNFSMRVPLIDGQGNFGSIDGDSPAAMRYTESRLARISDDALVADINEGTVDWRPTYDGSGLEPVVLPARIPVMLVNGAEGIAVGMATKMAPHNLGEVIDATLALMDDPDLGVEGLMRLIPGPDFPTGGVIQGRGGIREAFDTGAGRIVISGVHSVEQLRGGKQAIIITELPYQVSPAGLTECIGRLVNGRVIDGVTELRDESALKPRIVMELRRDANVELILNHLRKHSNFVLAFSVNATCLDSRGTPRVMGLVEILSEFIAFRRKTIRRRTEFRLNKARTALETQIGLFAARSQVDEVIRRIRASADRDAARASLAAMDFPCEGELAVLIQQVDPEAGLPATFHLSDAQARTILELRFQSLTGLEQDAIATKARELLDTIRVLSEILNDAAILDGIMRREMDEVKAKHATPRLTRIESAEPADLTDDDYRDDKDVVLTLTSQGYVKITALDTYREQSRGGKGRTGMDTKADDFVTSTLVCSIKRPLLFFTSRGIAHVMKAYMIPEVAANARGKPIVNLLKLREGETIAAVMPMPYPDAAEGRNMIFVTSDGDVRRNPASEFSSMNKAGKKAMNLEDENGNRIADLLAVMECGDDDDVVLASKQGKASRFPVGEIRMFKGRDSTGVKGIKLGEGDEVLSAAVLRHFDATPQEREAFFSDGTVSWKDEVSGSQMSLTLTPERMAEMRGAQQMLLTVTGKGFGKLFPNLDFRTTGRNVQGVFVGQFGSAVGDLVACFPVEDGDGIVLVTDGGQVIRRTRRTARGVRLFDLPEGQVIVDVARIPAEEVA